LVNVGWFFLYLGQKTPSLAYDLQQRTRLLRRFRQRAATLGFELVNDQTGEVFSPGVSGSGTECLGSRPVEC
jgi:hypothetical protein